ncbi:BON domain-containing protein [Thiomonas intermedia]|uniref:BON domain-containing protein n=1 Tax=Thiomonas intermedia TaxID=926 RepID=UPI001FE5F498|nr:BON domain-containing protein [Thiomonas intermedia]
MPSSPPDTTPRAAAPNPQEADRRLHAQVMERLSQTSLRWLDIQIHVQHGLVRLCGSLRDARLRAHAEWLVFTTDGVHAVCSDWRSCHAQRAATPSHTSQARPH